MGAALGQILGNAVGVAISPIPIIALILMLFSPAAARNSVAFMFGWMLGLTAVALIVVAIGFDGAADGDTDSGSVLKIVIGVLLLLLALKQWRGRPLAGTEPDVPGWMTAIDDFSMLRAFGLGVLLAAPNPKNLGLTVAAATTVTGAGLSTGQEVGTMLLFTLIASVTIIVPVVFALVMGERAAPVLDSAKLWLMANNSTVMMVLFVVLGAKVLGDGIAPLG